MSFTSSSLAETKESDWLNIDITGVDKPLKKNILAHLGSLPETQAQRRAFLFSNEEKIQLALESMGYYHGKISHDIERPKEGPWRLKLNIDPGKPVTLNWINIAIDGSLKHLPAFEAWLPTVEMLPGDQLNQGQYESVKTALLNLALSEGYFDAKYVKSEILVNRDLNVANITLHLNAGTRYHFGDISFQGSTLNPAFLNALVPFPKHEFYSTDRVAALNNNLLKTGYFSNIKVLPQVTNTEHNYVPVTVDLTNKPSHTIDLGAGIELGDTSGNSAEPKLSMKWRTPQINQWGHSQETWIEWSRDSLVRNSYRFQTAYTIPLSHPLDDRLVITMAHVQDRYGVKQTFDPEQEIFITDDQLESTESSLQLERLRLLPSQWYLGYSVRYLTEYYEQSGVDYDPEYYIFGIGIQRTIRGDDSLDPASGHRLSFSTAIADPTLGSETRFIRMEAKALWVDTFAEKHRFVARFDLGAIISEESLLEELPPSLRFFAGGDGSIRGYGYQEVGPNYQSQVGENTIREVIGGRYLAVGSLEYQYYFAPEWRVSAFIDAGNAFNKTDLDPVVAVGPGIAWISPVGPIKLDIGFGLNQEETLGRSWRLHLTMGSVL